MRTRRVRRVFSVAMIAASLLFTGSMISSLPSALTSVALAGQTHADYLAALAKAEAKAERAHPAQGSPFAEVLRSGTPLYREFLGRDYQVGESWEVAAFAESSTMARKTDNPSDLPHLLPPEQRPGSSGQFHYVVTAVSQNSVTVRISQGGPPVDPRVKSLSITFNGHMAETDKAYVLDGVANPVHVSPEGVHSRVARLELFPLDPFELATADRVAFTETPKLPRALSAYLTGDLFNFAPPSQVTELRQDDFFGRPVRAVWRRGDPWPRYLSTVNGSAVLVSSSGGPR